MLTPISQRWRLRRGVYRPSGEVISTREYDVAAIEGDNEPKAFITRHHYSGSYPAAQHRFGLYRKGRLVGVAVFSTPCNYLSISNCLPGDPKASTELGRLVLLDEVPGNGESWFIARCFAELRSEGLTGVISFSDPEPRTDVAGGLLFVGHVGTIYQATNGVYLGRSAPKTLLLLPDGTVMHKRALAKIRKRDRGWEHATAKLVAHGARPLRSNEDAPSWVRHWTAKICRRLRHGGNHKYCWALDKRARRHLPRPRPYPKVIDHPRITQAVLVAALAPSLTEHQSP